MFSTAPETDAIDLLSISLPNRRRFPFLGLNNLGILCKVGFWVYVHDVVFFFLSSSEAGSFIGFKSVLIGS